MLWIIPWEIKELRLITLSLISKIKVTEMMLPLRALLLINNSSNLQKQNQLHRWLEAAVNAKSKDMTCTTWIQ